MSPTTSETEYLKGEWMSWVSTALARLAPRLRMCRSGSVGQLCRGISACTTVVLRSLCVTVVCVVMLRSVGMLREGTGRSYRNGATQLQRESTESAAMWR